MYFKLFIMVNKLNEQVLLQGWNSLLVMPGSAANNFLKYKIKTKRPSEFHPPKPLLIANYSRRLQHPLTLAAMPMWVRLLISTECNI
jgi:hypothetical protein